jgi:hypothetical protein
MQGPAVPLLHPQTIHHFSQSYPRSVLAQAPGVWQLQYTAVSISTNTSIEDMRKILLSCVIVQAV